MNALRPLLAGLFLLLISGQWAAARAAETRHVLLIASYHSGLAWTDGQISGLRDGLREGLDTIDLHVEYLDTKRVAPTLVFYERMAGLLTEKYRQVKLDLVVAQDDDALDFALQQRLPGRLLHGLPIVFSGVAGHRADALAQEPAITGVFDDADIGSNIGFLQKIRPGLQRVVFVHDQSRTGLAQMRGVEALAGSFPDLRFEFLSGQPVRGIQLRLGALDEKSAVILLTFNQDADGRVLSHEEASALWAKASPVPVIAKEDGMLAPGVLGGLVVASRQQGMWAAENVRRVLHGVEPKRIPMAGGITAPIFDDVQLKRFQIADTQLPAGSEIRNRSRSLRETHPREFWLLIALVASLGAIIALLLAFGRRSRLAQADVARSERNYREILGATNEAIFIQRPDGRIIEVNSSFSRLYGFAESDAPTLSIEDLSSNVPPYSPDEAAVFFNRVQTEGPQLFEWHARHKDGSLFWVEVALRKAEIGGEPRLVAAVREIELRKQAEQKILQLNEDLERRVEERTAALVKASKEVQVAMTQLAKSERLASLGSLVAGVAHELNTPLGNANTVSSALRDRVSEFNLSIQDGTLRRSLLDRFTKDCTEASAMIERNIGRANDLISSFKQVAVDQTSIRRRPFDLREVLCEVLDTLHPRLKRTEHTVDVRVPQGIILDSYPGPLDQVIANFVHNSVVHGFGEEMAGCITISARCEGDEVILDYADDGRGMSQAVAARAFDPFFTTRLGTGGSGLGLYIVHNIVNTILGGTMTLETAPGEGVHYTLHLPLTAPMQPEHVG